MAEEPRVYKTKSKNAQEAHEAIRPTSAAILPSQARRQDRSGPVQALLADLEARGRLPDGARAVRHRRRRPGAEQASRSGNGARRASAARQRLDAREAGLHRRLPGRRRRQQARERKRPHPAGDERRRRGHAAQRARRPALHRAAAALLGSLAREGAGRARHRPSLDLRHDHLDAQGSRVRRHGQSPVHPDRHRQDRRRVPDQALPQVRRVRLHRHAGRRARRGLARRRRLDEPLKKFWKPFIAQVEHIEKNVSREEVAQARELGKDPVSGKPVTVRMGRYGPFVQIGTKDDEEKPKFAGLRPGQKMDLIKLPEALELFKLPRQPRQHRRRRAGAVEHRPLRPVHQVRREVRLAEAAGRSVHGRRWSARWKSSASRKKRTRIASSRTSASTTSRC